MSVISLPSSMTNGVDFERKVLIGTRLFYERAGLTKEMLPEPPEGFHYEFDHHYKSHETYVRIKARCWRHERALFNSKLAKWFFEHGFDYTVQ